MRLRASPTVQMRAVLIKAARKLRVRSPNGCEMDTKRSTDMNVSNRSETYEPKLKIGGSKFDRLCEKETKKCAPFLIQDLGSGDGKDADDCALPRHHPMMGVLIVLAAEADVTLAQTKQVDPDAHVGRYRKFE